MRLAVLFAVLAACSHRDEDVAALRQKLVRARRVLPPPAEALWAEEGPEVPMKADEVVEVLASDIDIPELPLLWDTKKAEEEKVRRWLRSNWLHRPTRSHEGDPARVHFAIVYRPSKILFPRHVDANRNDGGEIVADVTVVDLERRKAICGTPAHATNGAHLTFPIGGPTGLTPQEALEVDLRRNLRERARMSLLGTPRCRKLPLLP